MKKLLFIIMLVAFAIPSFAESSDLATDGKGIRIMGFAPNGMNSVTLGLASVTYDMSTLIAWSAWSTIDCKARIMPTSAKAAYPQFTIPATQWTTLVVNKATPFLNMSGCTSGHLQSQ